MSYYKSLFDRAISIEIGQKVLVPCRDAKHVSSVRTSLWRQKKIFLENLASSVDFDITITSTMIQGNHYVILSKESPLPLPLVIDESGNPIERFSVQSEKEEQIENPIITPIASPDLEKARIRQAMIEDGISEEEISAYFGDESKTSKIDTSGEDSDNEQEE